MKYCSYCKVREGKYTLKNGKLCCEKSWNSCPSCKEKNSKSNIGKIRSSETIEKQRQSLLEGYKSGKIKVWNKNLTKEDDPRIAEYGRKGSSSSKGREAWNKGNGEYCEGEKNGMWKGGCNGYWHRQAWKLFGKDECEICKMTNKEHIIEYEKRLGMHNTLTPKDYTVLETHAWSCLCKVCHTMVEEDQKRILNRIDGLIKYYQINKAR